MNKKPLRLIALNEINFDFIDRYVSKYDLKNLKKLQSYPSTFTSSEQDYELIEPWIQWVSVHTCQEYREHKVFRLGDICKYAGTQIFENIEKKGFKVGCISPMNSANSLKEPSFFIPDPWTLTKSDGSFFSRNLHEALVQTVNDNTTGKITKKSIFILLISLFRFGRIKNYPTYIKLFWNSKNKKWNKSLFLDVFLFDVYLTMYRQKKPDFSTVFLNSFAHIQHHYFLNSEFYDGDIKNPNWYCDSDADPLKDALIIYDRIIGDLFDNDSTTIIATGLQQVPYNIKKFYFRLKNHKNFLQSIGITDFQVYPRMTRDFLMEFKSSETLNFALSRLDLVTIKGKSIFKCDVKSENELFVTLTYPDELNKNDVINIGTETLGTDHLCLVAIKNGMHDPKGYQFILNGEGLDLLISNGGHVSEIGKKIIGYFNPKGAK